MGVSMRFEEVKAFDKDFDYNFIVDTDGKPVKAMIKDWRLSAEDPYIAEDSNDPFKYLEDIVLVAETEKVPWLEYLLG